ncbi:MAG: (Fe-S)-binding protein [Deltaproteobacteria bacterium]|nr:(Fe-S)-binding protein [Deltaproteobacteria bacterium]
MAAATPFIEVADAIVECGGKDLTLCYQCATCTGSCPWGYVEPLNMRRLIHLAQLGLEGYEGEDLWRCTTCGTCTDRCPRGVAIIDLVRAIRGMMGETGLIPQTLRSAVGSVRANGNPWSGERKERNAWAEKLEVPRFDASQHEYLLFGCCMPSYDPRSRKVVQAATKVLRAAGVRFGVLGSDESCCGEAVRKIGSEEVFGSLVASNGGLFTAHGVKKVIALSPHCYHTFKNEYPEQGVKVEVIHISELLAELIGSGKLTPSKPLDATVTYHDPCYLGRHNGIFDPPRQVLQAIPGITFKEMIRIRESSLCCGGGGGRMWMETKRGDRFSDLRIPEALAVGATVLATSCFYCISMLEDSRLTSGCEDKIEIRDLTELVAESLG